MSFLGVAPARERGLKCLLCKMIWSICSRSRKGAWIEMDSVTPQANLAAVAPARERGLKYECLALATKRPRVAPARERGLKFCVILRKLRSLKVAPARERGLKSKRGE